MKSVVIFVCAVLAFVNGEVGIPCDKDSQCDEGECCQILSDFIVVSKRASQAGTCQRYALTNEPCDIFGMMNGYCGCAPGLHCEAVTVPIDAVKNSVEKRRLMAPPEGYTYDIKCVKDSV